MLRRAVSRLSAWTEHPVLFSLLLLSVAFVLGGVVVDAVTGNATATGFFAVYATLAAGLGLLGAAAVLVGKLVTRIGRAVDAA